MTFEIECVACAKKHRVKRLDRSLVCCSTRDGVRRLIGAFRDPETGREWFTVMRIATLRIVTKRGTNKDKTR